MFVWFFDRYAESYPQTVVALRRSAAKPLQHDLLLYGIIELIGLTGTYPSARSFLSD